MQTITIKVGKVPGTIQEVVVTNGTSVNEVLEIAGITDVEGYELRAGGSNVTSDAVLTQDTSLLLMKQIKGNSTIMVKVGKVPGTIQEIAVENGTNVAYALELAGITDTEGYEVRVGGSSASFDTQLTSDTSVLLMKQIKGNRN